MCDRTVTFIDSTGIITGHCNNEAVTPQNLDASYDHCTVTFPTATTTNDIVSGSYGHNHKNGATAPRPSPSGLPS
jgi:hypothetical protein